MDKNNSAQKMEFRRYSMIIPYSELYKKAVSLKMTEQQFIEFNSKSSDLKVSQELMQKVFHPSQEQIQEDEERMEKFLKRGFTTEWIQEKLSFVSPFKEFLGISSDDLFQPAE